MTNTINANMAKLRKEAECLRGTFNYLKEEERRLSSLYMDYLRMYKYMKRENNEEYLREVWPEHEKEMHEVKEQLERVLDLQADLLSLNPFITE